uniref:Uncharacterized protein LOC101489517 n=1 Tax=Cicer arietinum TaxID=3827 RepID=A0A1S2Z7I6_CICAR|nr:uncharacterized protein LOC101489517 [Cicer arietinum]
MKKDESISDLQTRFTHIINNLHALGKVIDNEQQIGKVMRCLTREWQPKITAIAESKDLAQTHKAKSGPDTDDSKSESDEEPEIGMLVRKFKKFLKKKGSQSECQGHIRFECYRLQNKNKPVKTKGKDQQPSTKRAYIAWNDNDEDSSDDSEDEEANLCLMANTDSESDSEVSTTSNPSYDELHDAFNELHTEYVSVLKQLISTKKLLEEKCMLYDEINLKHESLRDINEELKKEACALKCDVAKFNSGKNNLDRLLRNQRNLNVKTGLGYKQHMHVKGNQKFVKSKQMHDNCTGPNMKSSPTVVCHFCCKKGHTVFNCKLKKLANRGWKQIWKVKSQAFETNPLGPNLNWESIMVSEQWMLQAYDWRQVNVLVSELKGRVSANCVTRDSRYILLLCVAHLSIRNLKRVAHIHMDHLNRLVRKQLVLCLPNRKFSKDRLCDSCERSKLVKSSFPPIDLVQTSRVLQLVHMDLFGPSQVRSFGGNLYGYVLVDDYTRPILRKTPSELYKGRKPNLSYFRVFGCKCFVLNNGKEHLDKFDPKADEESKPIEPSEPIPPTNLDCVEPIREDDLPKEWKFTKNHPIDNIIGEISKGVSTRKSLREFCNFTVFVSQIQPKNIKEALMDHDWIVAMKEELNQFERNQVWTLVPKPENKHVIGTRSLIGSLLYLTAGRPDIMLSVCMCARYQANPKESHLSAVKRLVAVVHRFFGCSNTS